MVVTRRKCNPGGLRVFDLDRPELPDQPQLPDRHRGVDCGGSNLSKASAQHGRRSPKSLRFVTRKEFDGDRVEHADEVPENVDPVVKLKDGSSAQAMKAQAVEDDRRPNRWPWL